MRDSTELLLNDQGIRLDCHRAKLLGLEHDSACWGAWWRPRGKTEGRVSDDVASPFFTFPQLIVATPHPDLWTSVFFIDARLRRTCEALPAFLEMLRELKLNILTINTAIASHKQQYVSVLCHNQVVTDALKTFLKPADAKGNKWRDEYFRASGFRLLIYMSVIHAKLRTHKLSATALHPNALAMAGNPWLLSYADFVGTGLEKAFADVREAVDETSEDLMRFFEDFDNALIEEHKTARQHLPPAFREQAYDWRELLRRAESRASRRDQPESKREVGSEWLREMWRTHSIDALSVRAPLTLAYARYWSVGEPVRLAYERSIETLCGQEQRQIQRGLEDACTRLDLKFKKADVIEAMPVLASFNWPERILRCRFLRRGYSRKQVFSLRVKFGIEKGTTVGTLKRIVDALNDAGLLVERISAFQRGEKFDHKEVAGVDITAAFARKGRPPGFEALRDSVLDALRRKGHVTVDDDEILVTSLNERLDQS